MQQVIIKVKQKWLGWLKMGVILWIFGIATLVGLLASYLLYEKIQFDKKVLYALEQQKKAEEEQCVYTVDCEELKAFARLLKLQK